MAGRPASETLTAREAKIMDILWQSGSATAEMVRAELPDHPHDSTVRTLLRILGRKGYVRQESSSDGPAVYRPIIPRTKAQKKAIRSLLERFFGGSTESLLIRLIEDEGITASQIESLKRSAKTPEKKRKPGGASGKP